MILRHCASGHQEHKPPIRRIAFSLFSALVVAAPAFAAGTTSPSAFKGFGNNKDPIQIEADNMGVTTADQIVTFNGSVTVHQKDTQMVTQVLKVFYDNSPQATPATPAPSAPATATSNAQLRRFEASGGLKITEPDQTVTGDSGWFDIASQKAEIDGNVVLVQAKNVARGAKLLIDLKTGKYDLQGDGKRVILVLDPNAKDGPAVQAKPK